MHGDEGEHAHNLLKHGTGKKKAHKPVQHIHLQKKQDWIFLNLILQIKAL